MRGYDNASRRDVWYWCGSCKTQYASLISEAHFVHCHTTLTSILDHAIALGIDVSVSDEGNYWDTRDVNVLLGEVRRMNHIVAVLAGAVSDAIEPGAVVAPIFEHREFERIEMEP